MDKRGPVGRAIWEALGSVASPVVAERVLELALDLSGADGAPEEPQKVRAFVSGPLQAAVRMVLGEESEASVSDSLSPIVEMMEAAAARSSKPPRPKVFLVASADRGFVDRLARHVGTEQALAAPDLFALLRAVEANLESRLTLVLDCESPVIQPSMLGVLGPVLPARCRVLLWRVGDVKPPTGTNATWVRLGPEVPEEDVLRLCTGDE